MFLIVNLLLLLLLCHFSRVRLCATPWTVACQAPPSMGFSRQEYWSGLPCPPAGDLPDPGVKPESRISSNGRQILCCWCHQGSLVEEYLHPNCWNLGKVTYKAKGTLQV